MENEGTDGGHRKRIKKKTNKIREQKRERRGSREIARKKKKKKKRKAEETKTLKKSSRAKLHLSHDRTKVAQPTGTTAETSRSANPRPCRRLYSPLGCPFSFVLLGCVLVFGTDAAWFDQPSWSGGGPAPGMVQPCPSRPQQQPSPALLAYKAAVSSNAPFGLHVGAMGLGAGPTKVVYSFAHEVNKDFLYSSKDCSGSPTAATTARVANSGKSVARALSHDRLVPPDLELVKRVAPDGR